MEKLFPEVSKNSLILISALLFSFSIYAQTGNNIPSVKLAFISDTQKPMWIEDVFLKSNHNEKATEILLNDIPGENPSEIYFLGDVVNLACKNERWKLIDTCLSEIHADGIPTHGCLGNHEVMRNKKKGEENFQVRFPDHVNTGYAVIEDSIATIFLNSNFSKISKEQISKQDEWYKQELSTLDSTPGIRVIIVACHHAPYSDSKIVGSSKPVQEHFIPPFIQSGKCKLFITGHAHMFQHFIIQGKDFLVIGGGGGIHQPLKKNLSGQTDLAPDYKPMFHYLLLTKYSDHLNILSRRLKDDFSGVEDGLSFDVSLEN